MALIHIDERMRRLSRGAAGRSVAGFSRPALLGLLVVIVGAACFIAYVLWPRWPSPAGFAEIPSLPITVAGVAFNVPPKAVRRAVQRRAGAHERVDLAFIWPSLEPPQSDERPRLDAADSTQAEMPERLFVTITAAGETLAPDERIKSIYPRYAASEPSAGPDGLAILPFRDGTPYHGEDLVYDAAAPENFIVRCSRDDADRTPDMCLYAKRIETADIVVRFPRDWLDDWRLIDSNIERLIAGLRPHPH